MIKLKLIIFFYAFKMNRKLGRVVESNNNNMTSIKVQNDYPNNKNDLFESIIEINSKDRYTGAPTDFNYSLSQYGKSGVKYFRVNKVTIPYSFYNIREQTFTVSVDNNPPMIFTIPGGSYTALSLINELTTLINPTITSPLTITYNQNTSKFTLSIASPHTFAINFTNILSAGSLMNYNLGRQLGFITLIQTQAATHVSDIVSNLNATINIYIASAALTSYVSSYFNLNRANVIQAIPIQVNSFSYIVWENLQQSIFRFDDRSVAQMDFKLIDDYGNIMDLNSLDWTLELSLYGDSM